MAKAILAYLETALATDLSMLMSATGGTFALRRTRVHSIFSSWMLGLGISQGVTSKTTRPRQEETCQGPVGRSESCYELASESFTSWSACCLAFLVSALTLALGSSVWIAFPRLIGFDVAVEVPFGEMPSILSFRAVNPPGISRFLATWAAATH